MVTVKPFCAVRPAAGYAEKVAALPYDVMNSEEARQMVSGNPYSFLHVDKAEIDLPVGMGLYDEQVYRKARENLDGLMAGGILIRDPARRFYVYSLTMDGHTQSGIVGCPSIDDCLGGRIKKHELTRADKEADRIRHIDALDANTGPIFLAHRPQPELGALTAEAMEAPPLYDFVAEDGVRHRAWGVGEAATEQIGRVFGAMDALYIADGHHRCASAVKVGAMRREAHPGYAGDEEFNFFLAVIFPSDQLRIFDYNRVVQDLRGMSPAEFLKRLEEKMEVAPYSGGQFRPGKKHEFGLFMDGRWFCLRARPETIDEGNPVSRLDVSILQEHVLAPMLGIADPRTDTRIDFVGGIRGLGELERRVQGGMAAAFSMFPTTLDDLMDIADNGMIMPPKSTWFEPKLRSGLFIHTLA
ncbi:MAG: DUF1015 family protein [Clostridiales Family XIII bacterium]|jgi:uncharacterized protein (DUF1015 family)|nr:DUF1015 family protein [Clostridiales Family XIII bacterium]